MRPELTRELTWSFQGGREVVEQKNLVDELPAIAESYIQCGGGNQNLSDRRDILDPLDWEQEVSIKYETSTKNGPVSRRASFDAYKDGVLVEHESGEQMRANWHLMKMEAAYRDPRGLSGNRNVDAGVLLNDFRDSVSNELVVLVGHVPVLGEHSIRVPMAENLFQGEY